MSWEGLGENPVPGDPDAVRAAAARLARIGEQAELLHGRLRALDGGSGPQVWRGDAADKFRDMLSTIGPDLARLSSGHHDAEQALRRYADALESAQRQARQAETDAERAISDRKVAKARADQASTEASSHDATVRATTVRLAEARVAQLTAPPDPVYHQQLQQYQQQQGAQQANARSRAGEARQRESAARTDAGRAEGRLAAAKKLADQAASLRDDAARTAVRRLDDAGAPGIRHKSFLERSLGAINDKVRHAVADPRFLDWMEGLSDVGSAMMTLGQLVALVPGLQGFGAGLFAFGVGFKGLAFIGTLVAAANGKASAGQVAWRGLDMGLSIMPAWGGIRAARAAAKGAGPVGSGLARQVKRAFNYSGRGGPSKQFPGITPGHQLGNGTEKALRWVNKHTPDPLNLRPKTYFQLKTGTDVLTPVVKDLVIPITKPIAPDPVQRAMDGFETVTDVPEKLVTTGVDRAVYGREGFTPTH